MKKQRNFYVIKLFNFVDTNFLHLQKFWISRILHFGILSLI